MNLLSTISLSAAYFTVI